MEVEIRGIFPRLTSIVRELSRDLFLSIFLFLEAGRLFREWRLSNFERQLNKSEGNATGRKLRGNCCTETVEPTPGKNRSARWPSITTWIIYKVRVTRFRITQRDVSRVHGPRHFRTKRGRDTISSKIRGTGEAKQREKTRIAHGENALGCAMNFKRSTFLAWNAEEFLTRASHGHVSACNNENLL